MRTGIAVFAYNRSKHLQKVLEGLKKNKGVPEIYIFQDGLKCEEHRSEWEKTNQLINDIDWCKVIYYQAPHNKGLARSIVDGVNVVFEKNDAIVVLEDDCVPAADFIGFMKQCFEKYDNDKRVYSVSGLAWPMELKKDEYDVYGCGRISSWGWGTWKDRWEEYSRDNDILERIKNDKDKSRNLAVWGNDCESMLLGTIAGKIDSWAIYWALHVIENKGICINPYHSLIKNIGLDGTGVHCGLNKKFEVALSNENKERFILPDKINILRITEEAFVEIHGSYTAVSDDISKEDVLIYGLGNFFSRYEKEVNHDYNIKAFLDRKKKGWYAGKRIIGLDEIACYTYSKIVIMIQNIQECIHVSKQLLSHGIQVEDIVLGRSVFGECSQTIDEMKVQSCGNLLVRFGEASLKVKSNDEFNNVYEVFNSQIYNYFVNNGKHDVILDVGNIGNATLYFALKKNVEKVYGYEPFKEKFLDTKENLMDCPVLDKIELLNYGISNKNEVRTIGYNRDMSCGKSTLSEIREQIEVKKASEVVAPLFTKHLNCNMILKMNCEGEEYYIVEDLLQSGLLGKFSFIMLEWHYKGKESILNCLKKAGLSWWCLDKSPEMGFVYAYGLRL